MISIDSYNFSGKKVLIRVDFNVPLNEQFEVTDDTRIKAAMPTIKKVLADSGSVILMSHLGRPKNGPENKFSLKHILPYLSKHIGTKVFFSKDCIGEDTLDDANALEPGQVLLLENLRFHKEEEKGDEGFAKQLAELGNVYINDAFGTAHRAHASTAVIAQYFDEHSKMFGYLMKAEVENANKVLHHAQKPFTAILGGAKVSDKILIIENLMERADNIIIGGGMSYTFFKALGGQIGNSLCENDQLELAKSLLEKAKQKGIQFLLPIDSIIADKFAADADTKEKDSNQIPDNWMGLDIGSKAIESFKKVISASKTILWNGPMGVFEMDKFKNGTRAVALAIVESTANGAFSLIGGGDSVAAINQFNLADKVSYVSTGGGAMLEYFEGKELPGIKAIFAAQTTAE